MSKISIKDFELLIENEMPWALESNIKLEEISFGSSTMRIPFEKSMLRPGGTVSGPTMMMLADASMYSVVLSALGLVTLAVTTSFNINFLRRPNRSDLLAKGQVLKIGKRLVVVEVTLFSDGSDLTIAHATGTYSIP